MASLSNPQMLMAAAALFGATGANLDARYGVSYDLRKLSQIRTSQKRVGERIRELGGEATLYRLLELADQGAEALWFEGRSLTYGEMKISKLSLRTSKSEDRDWHLLDVDQLAEFLRRHGVQAGHVVGVFCTNSPEMAFTIYALGKLGAVAALLNSALRSKKLSKEFSRRVLISGRWDTQTLHRYLRGATRRCDPRPCRVRAEQHGSPRAETVWPQSRVRSPYFGLLPAQTWLNDYPDRAQWTLSPVSGSPIPTAGKDSKGCLDTHLHLRNHGWAQNSPNPPYSLKEIPGKPKAVSLKTFLLLAVSTPYPQDTTKATLYYPLRTYCCLPLFHATGFLVGLVHSCGVSGTLCLSRKFSASKFAQELAESNATRLLYVGELLRYALSAPPSSDDKKHNCIVATGNGLQADVWERFQERFGIPEIREIYRSTESVSGFDNMCGGAIGVGKVGFSGLLGRFLEDTMFLVKYDQETQTLYRHPKTDFCVPVPDGEPGEAIGRVTMMDFYSDYYKDSSATSGKLAKDVFKKGDLFQRTGDLLVRESDGWVRFHERTGDTFRWRGENVSSAEVKAFMVQLPNVHDIVVYGTKVPG
jgi:acyl-CoA synthetase (AMP-forming)/AMP-acid ligase II